MGFKSVWGQVVVSQRKQEISISLDVFGPLPSSELSNILDPNLGAGLNYRTHWPKPLYTELGVAWVFMQGEQPQKLFIVPLYTALAYRLPTEGRLDLFAKLGLGSSYIEVRPNNVSGWDPFLLLGFEISILATRFLRIGVRFDYFHIYEKHLDAPKDSQESPEIPAHVDVRFREAQNFSIINGEFIRFGVLFGYVF